MTTTIKFYTFKRSSNPARYGKNAKGCNTPWCRIPKTFAAATPTKKCETLDFIQDYLIEKESKGVVTRNAAGDLNVWQVGKHWTAEKFNAERFHGELVNVLNN